MPKWSPKAKEYTVKIAYDKHGLARAAIPAPIIQGLDRPTSVTFVLSQGEIKVIFARDRTIIPENEATRSPD